MSDLHTDIQAAIAAAHERQQQLPIIVADEATIDFVAANYPWYPAQKLVASAVAVPGKALVIDPSLDWRP